MAVEKAEQQKALVEPWGKHWSCCCGWWKGTSPDEATLNSEEIKAVAIAVIKLLFSEGISKGASEWVSELVNQSVSQKKYKWIEFLFKFCSKFLEWVY